MNRKQTIPLAFLLSMAVLLTSCATLYKSTISITSVVDVAMKNWAELSVAGKTTPAIDASVTATHLRYRQACGIAQKALTAYRDNGDKTAYLQALITVRTLAADILDALTPLITSTEANSYKAKLSKATVL